MATIGGEMTMAAQTEARISTEAYERLVLSDDDRKWELWDGVPREKPGMSTAHSDVENELGYLLRSQPDRSRRGVQADSGRLHRPRSTYVIPDVFIAPTAYVTQNLSRAAWRRTTNCCHWSSKFGRLPPATTISP